MTRILDPCEEEEEEEEDLMSTATASSFDHAHLSETTMGDSHRHYGGGLGFHRLALRQQQQLPPRPSPPQKRAEPRPRIGRLRSAGGEIMEVQGGHIVRAIGRKDRHSKVCTAKGPRDRRVRLAAHTAIQFYDVQDRLGYDRPSKAVDWLIQNAKAAIDQLAELPRWTPAAASSTSCAPPQSSLSPAAAAAKQPSSKSGELPIPSTAFVFGDGGDGVASFLPPSLDSDVIADTIKSFFPMAAAASAAASPPDLQGLRLSLQSFQDPISHNSLLASTSHLGFDAIAGGWTTEQSQRMAPWNVAETSGAAGSRGGFEGFPFDVPPPEAVPLHAMLGLSQLFSQRGPLQSSNPLSARGWAAEPVAPPAELQMYPAALQPSVSPMGFVSKADSSEFRIPAHIQGEEEEEEMEDGGGGGVSDKPPSASRH